MKSKPQKDLKLEGIIESHQKKEHHDPLDNISNQIIIIVFISLLFLASVFMFLSSEPNQDNLSAYAIVEYKNIVPEFKIFDNISMTIENIRSSNDQPYILMMMFVGWIMVAGLINIALHEKELKKQEELESEKKMQLKK
jgi:hypothetical protein